MIASSGQSIWVHDIVAVDRTHGAPDVIRGFLIDVSQRKRAEATARASEARLRQLIDTGHWTKVQLRRPRSRRYITWAESKGVWSGRVCGLHDRPVGRFRPADPVLRVSGFHTTQDHLS